MVRYSVLAVDHPAVEHLELSELWRENLLVVTSVEADAGNYERT